MIQRNHLKHGPKRILVPWSTSAKRDRFMKSVNTAKSHLLSNIFTCLVIANYSLIRRIQFLNWRVCLFRAKIVNQLANCSNAPACVQLLTAVKFVRFNTDLFIDQTAWLLAVHHLLHLLMKTENN